MIGAKHKKNNEKNENTYKQMLSMLSISPP